jgi:hypothetical protein
MQKSPAVKCITTGLTTNPIPDIQQKQLKRSQQKTLLLNSG